MYKIVLFSAGFTGLSVASGFALSIANQHLIDHAPKVSPDLIVTAPEAPINAIVAIAPAKKPDASEALVETASLESPTLNAGALTFSRSQSDLAPVISPRPMPRGNAQIAAESPGLDAVQPVDFNQVGSEVAFEPSQFSEPYQIVQSDVSFPDYQPASRRGKNVKPRYLIGVYR